MNNQKILEDLFQAYYDARTHKRNTINALQFEYNYEQELFKLYKEIIEKSILSNPASVLSMSIRSRERYSPLTFGIE